MPSIVTKRSASVSSTVGGMRLTWPVEVVRPRPLASISRGATAKRLPYMYCARRPMAMPARTDSSTAASMKPTGA